MKSLPFLIGKHITITAAKNTSLIGKHGIVVDETEHTFTVAEHHNKTTRTIIKDQIITIEETP
jgi:RNase P/RNase MRP subunit p29